MGVGVLRVSARGRRRGMPVPGIPFFACTPPILPQSVLRCFASFLNSGHSPDQFTFAITLSACAKLHNVELGRAVHCCIIKRGLQSASFCHGALIHLYANSHSLTSAHLI
ncbi:hypothetical protein VIGAN_UM156700 [Vigna angularis var. angularis]|uniref:Uncharacterized protein n=1 Tax=Vigna angularis var. angularis TaxID=157739 RepID=A0A0S3TEL0_PHAAN|nr:hypothetical protein VIGAN_UM126800 [Vigna angularis var. angularis]BAU03681.1 hypothetical protein VIGAN_UM156700 [Vigna angularis var. angularis]